MDWQIPLIRFGAAFLLGACIGIERQLHQRTAGLRTNILVALGAAGFTIFGDNIEIGDSVPRIVSQIVSGIGFLGAGAIMREGLTVQGLNTAATLWCSAALGAFCGMGYMLDGALFTFAIILTNTLLRNIENYLENRPLIKSKNGFPLYSIEINCGVDHEEDVRKLVISSIKKRSAVLKIMELKDRTNGHITLRAIVKNTRPHEVQMQSIIEDISHSKNVFSARWLALEDKNLLA